MLGCLFISFVQWMLNSSTYFHFILQKKMCSIFFLSVRSVGLDNSNPRWHLAQGWNPKDPSIMENIVWIFFNILVMYRCFYLRFGVNYYLWFFIYGWEIYLSYNFFSFQYFIFVYYIAKTHFHLCFMLVNTFEFHKVFTLSN